MTPAQLDIHGTASMFLKGKCDCEACKAAVAARIKHGTEGSYKKYRCRCDLCRAAVRAARTYDAPPKVTKWVPKDQPDAYGVDTSDAETEFSVLLQLPGLDQLSHGGSPVTGCRCPLCADARRNKAKKALAAMRPEGHGTTTGYTYGCRCSLCVVAGRAAQRARYAEQRATSHK